MGAIQGGRRRAYLCLAADGLCAEHDLLRLVGLAVGTCRAVGVGKIACHHVQAFVLGRHRGAGNIENAE
jgi:hypothetical protein